jgi:hypothetical protein
MPGSLSMNDSRSSKCFFDGGGSGSGGEDANALLGIIYAAFFRPVVVAAGHEFPAAEGVGGLERRAEALRVLFALGDLSVGYQEVLFKDSPGHFAGAGTAVVGHLQKPANGALCVN